MRGRIWKHALEVGMNELSLPVGSTILTVAGQRDKVRMWIVSDPFQAKESRFFLVVGTDNVVSEAMEYVGTAFTAQGNLVWHVFEADDDHSL